MYRVLESLPLAKFVGQECIQVGLGEFQIQFHFADGSSISAEGKWELWNHNSVLWDQLTPHSQREKYCVHLIIGQRVHSVSINVPTSFTLHFENEFALKIYDDSEYYESFSLNPSSAGSTHV